MTAVKSRRRVRGITTIFHVLLAFLWLVTHSQVVTGQDRRPQASVGKRIGLPKLANFAGIMIGLDDMNNLERRFGRGKVVAGGHPQGARVWRCNRGRWFIYADGFNYRNFGNAAVIDQLTLTSTNAWGTGIPHACLMRGQNLLLGRIYLGSIWWQVQRILRKNKIPSHIENSKLIRLENSGVARVNSSTTFTTWHARFKFRNDRLKEITVWAS